MYMNFEYNYLGGSYVSYIMCNIVHVYVILKKSKELYVLMYIKACFAPLKAYFEELFNSI